VMIEAAHGKRESRTVNGRKELQLVAKKWTSHQSDPAGNAASFRGHNTRRKNRGASFRERMEEKKSKGRNKSPLENGSPPDYGQRTRGGGEYGE